MSSKNSILACVALLAVSLVATLAPRSAEAQRKASPQRPAPQAGALDDALYVVEPFFDTTVRIPRPYADARARLTALAAQQPSDPRVALRLGRVTEKLGDFAAATAAMERFATLAGREPNALRRLAAYYRGRAMAAEEVKVLDELASKLPPRERPPVYRRAIAATNDGRPSGVAVEPFYEKLVDLDLGDGETLREYVSLLLAAGDHPRALRAVERVASRQEPRTRALDRVLLSERARVHDRLGRRDEALAVYEGAFDPLWPRAVASDYYSLLSRYGIYRERRRTLQEQAAAGAGLDGVSRLFNIYAYEGNLPAGARLLGALEERKKSDWTSGDLELAASLYTQIGDYDQASRYLYSLYLRGGLAQGTPDRERILARLFTALATAGEQPTRLAPGGISLYRDIARLDARPGALNALLSLILAGNNPAAEYAAEQARAGGYLNRALAYTIYQRFVAEYPSSPRLGAMTADLVGALADLGADREVVAAGTAYLAKAPDNADAERVALAVADAHVRLKDRKAERAVLQGLLDRSAARNPANRPLLERNPTRWVYRPDTTVGGEESYDDAPDLFVTPSGRPVEGSRASSFRDDGLSSDTSTYEPATDSYDGESDDYDESQDYRGDPDLEPARASYARLLERMIASYETDEQQPAALAFFWGEVRKHPKDEGLHERFLAWLGTTSLVNEQIKAYDAALKQYDRPTWLHRFARWHVRRGRGAEVRRLTEQVVNTLADEELASYLREFAGYGGTARGDELNWDNAIALQMTRLALKRFPNNPAIASMLLERLASAKQWDEWERVAREHYFADPTIRATLLERMSKSGALAPSLERARVGAAGGLEGAPGSAFAYAVFAADASRWLSHHDDAVAAYRRLVALYPGDKEYAKPLADLLRSFGSRDPRLYTEAAGVLDALATVHPTEHRFATEAGEVLASAGDMQEAATRWRNIVTTAPGSPSVRLEVATIFWDYYQFDDAAREIVALRDATRDQTLYSFRLGAIYDSKRELDRAIPEYVKTLAAGDSETAKARDRLAELSRRDGMLARIEAAYTRERGTSEVGGRLAIGYADFLRAIDRTADAVNVLNREIASSRDLEFLEDARDRFRSWRQTESEIRALERVIAESRDERERIRARLQLAALYDDAERVDDAVAVFRQLVAENPTNVGVLEEATRFLWRVGRVDDSTRLSREVIARARGDYRKQFTLELARRQIDTRRLDDAEQTLRAYYAERPLDADVFAELARVLGESGKGDALAALYRETLDRVAKGELPEEERIARVAELRRGIVATLDRLGRHAEAVDQHIEIVNREPESAEALDAAFDYAARTNLVDRLVAYYEKTAREAFKDYRWSLVLARLHERNANPTGAAEAWRRAVANEPQRLDLRSSYAASLERAGRDEDAVAELRRAWEIDGREPEWLVRVARIRARQGRVPDAERAVDEAIASRSKVTAAQLFTTADRLAEWGLLEKAASLYDRGLDMARATPSDVYLDAETIGRYVRAAARVRPPADLFARLEGLRRAFLAEASRPDSYVAASARSHAKAIEDAETSAFAKAAIEFGTSDELAALEGALRTAGSATPDLGEKRRYLAVARAASLLGAEEAIQAEVTDLALATFASDNGTAFRGALAEAVEMYSRRAMFVRAAERLESYRSRDPRPGDYDYDRRLAELYRLAGDTAREIAVLERLYASASGQILGDGGEQAAAVRRLLELYVATSQQERIVALAAQQSPYQLVLVNFLVERGDEALARRAVASAAISPVWVKARSAEIGLFFRDGSPEVEAAFRDVLRARPIGELVNAPFDAESSLSGADYYITARNYGVWLDLVANRPDAARDWIVGRLEQRPRDPGAQASLARYYLVRKTPDRALAHADLAVELDSRAVDAVAVRGEALHALGRVDEAIATWTRLVERRDAGSDELRVYFEEMATHGHLDAALGTLRPRMAELTARGRFGAVTELLGDLADFARATPTAWPAVADTIYGTAVDATDDLQIAMTVLREDLLPVERRTPFYRLLTDRLEVSAAALASDPDESYIVVGGDYLDPADELNAWRRRAADHLIATNALDEARALLASVEADRGSTGLRGEGSDDYSWVLLARATAELRAGRKAEALEAVGRYCSADGTGVSPDAAPDAARCAAAADVLAAGGAVEEADAFRETVFRRLLESRPDDITGLSGLAEVLYRRGRADEADSLLRRVGLRTVESASLGAAADVAARAGRFPLAIELRETVARLARADSTNALALARLYAASGDTARGGTSLVALVGDERAPVTVRAQALDLVVELAAGGSRPAVSGRSEMERILAARLSNDSGALNGLAASSRSPVAAVELGRVELAAGRTDAARAAFERALALDPDGAVANAAAFGGAVPIDALVRIYSEVGRGDAALALAARSSDYERREAAETLVFIPRPSGPSPAFETVGERNATARLDARRAALGALAEAAARLGRWDDAVAFARTRVALLVGPAPEREGAVARLGEIEAAQREAERRLAGTLRVSTAVSGETIAVRDFEYEGL